MHGYCWRRRHRHGSVGRLPKHLAVSFLPTVEKLTPTPQLNTDPLYLDITELEALRLIDLEKLTLEDAGRKMNTSRNTVWRLTQSGREKLIRAIIEGRQLIILKD